MRDFGTFLLSTIQRTKETSLLRPLYKIHQEHNDPNKDRKADGSNQACLEQGEGCGWIKNSQNKCGEIEANQDDND